MKCRKHPKYKAIRQPKSCIPCLVIWIAKQIRAVTKGVVR